MPFFGTIILVAIASAAFAERDKYNCQLQSFDVVIIPLKSTSSTVSPISSETFKPSTCPPSMDFIIALLSTLSDPILVLDFLYTVSIPIKFNVRTPSETVPLINSSSPSKSVILPSFRVNFPSDSPSYHTFPDLSSINESGFNFVPSNK